MTQARAIDRMTRGVRLRACVLALVVAGCGSGHALTAMDPAVRSQLRIDMKGVASAAATHNMVALQGALAALNADAASAHTAGKLTDAELADIRASLASIQTAAMATPRSAPAPSPTPPAPVNRPKKGGDNRQGKGKGDGGD